MIDTLAFINPLIGWMAQPWGRFIVSTAITVLGALIVAVLIWTGFKVADVRQAKKRQELWAEATDRV